MAGGVVVLGTLLLNYVSNQADRYAYAIAAKPMAADLHYASTGLQYQVLAGPVFALIFSTCALVAGHLADMWPRVRSLVAATMLWAAATAGVFWATAYWQLVLLRMVQAVGEAACAPLSTSIIASTFPTQSRGSALAVWSLGIYVGFGAAFGAGNKLVAHHGYRGMFLWFSLPSVVSAVMLMFVREPPRDAEATPMVAVVGSDSEDDQKVPLMKGKSQEGMRSQRVLSFELESSSTEDDTRHQPRARFLSFNDGIAELATPKRPVVNSSTTPQRASYGETLKLMWGTPGIALLFLASSVRNGAGICWAYQSNLFFETVLHQTPAQIAAWMSWIPVVAGGLGAVAGGFVSDKLQAHGGPSARFLVLIMSQLLAAPMALGVLLLPAPYGYLMLIGCNVVGEAWIAVAVTICVDAVPSNCVGRGASLYYFAINVLGGNMPLLVSPLSSTWSLKTALIVLYPGMYVLSAVLFFVTWQLHRKRRK